MTLDEMADVVEQLDRQLASLEAQRNELIKAIAHKIWQLAEATK